MSLEELARELNVSVQVQDFDMDAFKAASSKEASSKQSNKPRAAKRPQVAAKKLRAAKKPHGLPRAKVRGLCLHSAAEAQNGRENSACQTTGDNVPYHK